MLSTNRDFLHHNLALYSDLLQSLQNPTNASSSQKDPHPPHSRNDRPSITAAAATKGTVYCLIAILINHIRRVLVPWMGQFPRYHAIEDMKLARSSPHYFLEETMQLGVWEVVGWALQVYVVGMAGRIAREEVLRAGKKGEKAKVKARAMLVDVYRVVGLVVMLVEMERFYVESCCISAEIYAYTRLVVSENPGDGIYLRRLIEENAQPWDQGGGRGGGALLQWMLILRWIYVAVLPIILPALRTSSPTWGGAGWVMVVCGLVARGTVFLVRYSNKYFVVIQMSDLVVTVGWVVVAGVGWGGLVLRSWWR